MIEKLISLYKKQVVKGIFWVGSVRVVARISTVLRTIILARLLSPSDFGSYAVALLVLSAIETFTETGVNVVLIQKKNEDIDSYINTAWTVSIIRGFLIFLIIFATAPFFSSFFKSPSSLILIILISIVPLVRGFINPSVVKFEKDLRFHVDFWISGASLIVDSLVSIVIILILKSPIGLILGLLAGVVTELILSFIIVGPRPKLAFEKEKFRQILHGGKWVTAFAGFDFLSTQLDNVVVGRVLNVASLGLYQMAYRISIIPITEVSDIFNKVAFPLYTKITERKKLITSFLKLQGVMSLIIIPVCLVLFFFPAQVITILLGKNWLFATDALRILSIYGGVRAIFGATSSLFLSLNRQDYVAKITFIRLVGLAFTIIPLTLAFGIVGAAYSALFSSLLEFPVIVFYLFTILKKDKL